MDIAHDRSLHCPNTIFIMMKTVAENIADQTAFQFVTDFQFGDFLDQALRNCFVCRLRAEGMQKRLLTESDLDITQALELAWSIEAEFKDPCSIAGTSSKLVNVGAATTTAISSGVWPIGRILLS